MVLKSYGRAEFVVLVGCLIIVLLLMYVKSDVIPCFSSDNLCEREIRKRIGFVHIEKASIFLFKSPENTPFHKKSVSAFSQQKTTRLKRRFSLENSQVLLTSKSHLNTSQTVIDFSNENWINQFEQIKQLASSIRPMPPNRLSTWATSSNGYSKGLFYKSHSVVSNVCLTKKQDAVLLHTNNSDFQKEIEQVYHGTDFYNNNIRYISNSLSNNRKEDYFKHVFIFNDHGLYDDYSIFDVYSVILHIFLHPEEYPRFYKWMSYNGGLDTNTEFSLFLRSILFDLFGDKKPEEITFLTYNELRKRNRLCDTYMVFVGSWDVYHKGQLLPEPLASDILRAAAYKRFNIPVHQKYTQNSMQMVLADYSESHHIKNYDSLHEHLLKLYTPMFTIKTLCLSDEIQSVVTTLAMTDILISIYTPSLIRFVFMLPNSALILSQPPGYKDYRFKTLALEIGVNYKYLRPYGPYLKVCEDNNTNKACIEAVTNYRYSLPINQLDKCIDYVIGY